MEQLFICPRTCNSCSLPGTPARGVLGCAVRGVWVVQLHELLMKTHTDLKNLTQRRRIGCSFLGGHKTYSPLHTSTRNNCSMRTLISLWWLKNITDDHILKTSLRIWLYWLQWWRDTYKWSCTWEGKSTTDWKHDKGVADCMLKKTKKRSISNSFDEKNFTGIFKKSFFPLMFLSLSSLISSLWKFLNVFFMYGWTNFLFFPTF